MAPRTRSNGSALKPTPGTLKNRRMHAERHTVAINEKYIDVTGAFKMPERRRLDFEPDKRDARRSQTPEPVLRQESLNLHAPEPMLSRQEVEALPTPEPMPALELQDVRAYREVVTDDDEAPYLYTGAQSPSPATSSQAATTVRRPKIADRDSGNLRLTYLWCRRKARLFAKAKMDKELEIQQKIIECANKRRESHIAALKRLGSSVDHHEQKLRRDMRKDRLTRIEIDKAQKSIEEKMEELEIEKGRTNFSAIWADFLAIGLVGMNDLKRRSASSEAGNGLESA